MKRNVRRVDLLTKKDEQSQVKRSFLLAAISILIAILIFSFGISVLGGFADFLNKIFHNDKDVTGGSNFVQPPILDQLPQATNEAALAVSGLAIDDSKVDIYLNGEKVGDSTVDGGRFKYESLNLKSGGNEIKARGITGNNSESDFSKSYSVVLDNKEPELTIESPTDGQSFSGNNRVSIKGKTEPDAQVYANGFLANIASDGSYEVFVPLNEGDTEIEVKAVDQAGNFKSLKIRLHYSK